MEHVDLFAGGQRDRAVEDRINVHWYLLDLFFSYKYGEKLKFKRSLDVLRPYLDDKLVLVLEDLYESSMWVNPLKG